jgi:hypothetical protein
MMIERPHSQRGCRLRPTNDLLSSTSASRTFRTTTAGTLRAAPATKAGFTWWSAGAFFEGAHHRHRTDAEHASGIANAAAIERQVDYLLLDLWQPSCVAIVQ